MSRFILSCSLVLFINLSLWNFTEALDAERLDKEIIKVINSLPVRDRNGFTNQISFDKFLETFQEHKLDPKKAGNYFNKLKLGDVIIDYGLKKYVSQDVIEMWKTKQRELDMISFESNLWFPITSDCKVLTDSIGALVSLGEDQRLINSLSKQSQDFVKIYYGCMAISKHDSDKDRLRKYILDELKLKVINL